MAQAASVACFHCALPAGRRPLHYRVGGALQPFCCHGCYLVNVVTGQRGELGESLLELARLMVGVTGGMVVMIFSWSHYADRYVLDHALGEPDALALLSQYYVLLAATLVVAVLGAPLLRDRERGLAFLRGGVPTLIGVGAFSAYAASVVAVFRGGETYFDTATMILIFFTLGRFLEARGRAHASQAIRSLRGLVPDTARVLRPDGEAEVAVADLGIGERVLVRPGEMIPVDGRVREGCGSVDEASLTGESRPVTREVGDRLLAGTLSLDGAFVVSVTALAPDRAIARLARLAEEAKQQRPRWMRLADRVAAAFTPLVIALALGALAFWTPRQGPVPALLIALSVLLIACPCTLGVATPLAFWTGLAVAARRGILVRSGEVLERLAQVTDVFFDKTGTLTRGTFRLAGVLSIPRPGHAPRQSDALPPLQVAASLEARAAHPVAATLRDAAATAGLAELPVSDWRAEPGLGIRGRVAGSAVEHVLGSRRMMERAGLAMDPALDEAARRSGARDDTVVYLGSAGQVDAAFTVREEARCRADGAVRALGRLGARLAILTGDERGSAERLGAALGIGDIRCGLLPHEKATAVRAASAGPSARRVAMVGDGINDAAALAAAHVGIALGCGADVAREAADVAMIGQDLMQIPWLLRFSRRVRRTVVVNLVWAFTYNVAGIGLALSGRLPPVVAAMAMVVSSLFVAANTRRLFAGGRGPAGDEAVLLPRRRVMRRLSLAVGMGTLGLAVLGLGLWAALARAEAGTPDQLQAGKILYGRACATCHGTGGKGDGLAAALLDPRPRDFTAGVFKFRTTPTGSVPTLDDMASTVTHGLAGTAMGQWRELSTKDRTAVLLYIQSLSSRFGGAPPSPITVPAEPPFTADSVQRGAKLYVELDCVKCHGPGGRGDGPSAAELKDEWGYPTRAADLTQADRMKRGSAPRDIYLTLFTGLMGTPMPSYGGALENGGQEWDLVHYVASLSGGRGAATSANAR